MKSTPNLRSIWLLVVVAILSGCNEDSADPIETTGSTKSSSRPVTSPPPPQAKSIKKVDERSVVFFIVESCVLKLLQ